MTNSWTNAPRKFYERSTASYILYELCLSLTLRPLIWIQSTCEIDKLTSKLSISLIGFYDSLRLSGLLFIYLNVYLIWTLCMVAHSLPVASTTHCYSSDRGDTKQLTDFTSNATWSTSTSYIGTIQSSISRNKKNSWNHREKMEEKGRWLKTKQLVSILPSWTLLPDYRWFKIKSAYTRSPWRDLETSSQINASST
jgi:hypothetical protein